jgi:elongation factor Ts
MPEITPQMVKTLREKTGAGMADCKKALVDANGDMNEAIEILRKKGAASAAKRADRVASEGIIATRLSEDRKLAAIVEVNCETDFVARNAEFESYVNKVADALLGNEINNVDELMKIQVNGDTIEGIHNEILAKFGEKIDIRRFERIKTEGSIATYNHAGNKLAVVIEVSAPNLNDTAFALLRDIAMQIAAMNPQFIDRNDVDQATLAKEKEIYVQQAIDSGKPADIADRIATGKLEKFYQEQCLVEQAFVKDANITVGDVVKEISNIVGSEVKILSFRRYLLGENL